MFNEQPTGTVISRRLRRRRRRRRGRRRRRRRRKKEKRRSSLRRRREEEKNKRKKKKLEHQFKSLVRFHPEEQGAIPGSTAVEAGRLTTRPRRRERGDAAAAASGGPISPCQACPSQPGISAHSRGSRPPLGKQTNKHAAGRMRGCVKEEREIQ